MERVIPQGVGRDEKALVLANTLLFEKYFDIASLDAKTDEQKEAWDLDKPKLGSDMLAGEALEEMLVDMGGGKVLVRTRGMKVYEFSNHLGNVLVTISDKVLYDVTSSVYIAQVATAQDYYPFGSAMPGRKYEGGSGYRFGFNGKEDDKDFDGIQDYGFRLYNSQICRFLSKDPIGWQYPWFTPYQFAGNMPIKFIDVDGLEPGEQEGNEGDTKIEQFNAESGHAGYFTQWKKVNGQWVNQLGPEFYNLDADAVENSLEQQYMVWDNGSGQSQFDQDAHDAMITMGEVGLTLATAEVGLVVTAFRLTFKESVKFGFKWLFKKGFRKFVKEARAMMREAAFAELKEQVAAGAGEYIKNLTGIDAKAILDAACFVEGTMVLSADGLKPIEHIIEGDSVWAYSDSSHVLSKKVVINTVVKQTRQLVSVSVSGHVILTTPEHPFYVRQNWVKAQNLNVGDSLLLFDGRKVTIEGIAIQDTACVVYNFAVEDYHTYFVSEVSVLVHNDNPCSMGKKKGKGKNNLKPSSEAEGDHSTFARDNNGNIYKYETYEKTNSGHFNPTKRYDGGKPDGTAGAPHVNKETGEAIPTPHVQGKNIPGGVRTAEPYEIPKKRGN